jgi:UDP-N-acetylglucosamine:LPS N-acetylglucosamine transferase
MILRPDFYAPLALDKAAERERLGLDPRQPTAVVMFGGQGSTAMSLIERELDELQLVLMCGHHRQLARQLRARRSTAARAVVEFTTDVRRHLLLGDFFIGKPGPGSLSEAVHAGLPVLTQRNAWTLPQERYNTDWVLEQGLGRVLGSWREVRGAAGQLLARLDEFKARVRHIDNRAVFELPSILQQILHSGPAGRCVRAEWPSTRPMPYGVAAPQVGLAAPITLPG